MIRTIVTVFGIALVAPCALADLQAIDDVTMGGVVGQAMPIIETSGSITYDAIVYHPSDGTDPQVILPGGASTDGKVSTQSLTFTGQMFGTPQTGNPMDLLGIIFPIRVGAVDTDGDGESDRGGALFSFQPNVGMGTQYSPLSIGMDDETVNIDDQMFVTKQGILFLNAPLVNEPFDVPGMPGPVQLVPVKLF